MNCLTSFHFPPFACVSGNLPVVNGLVDNGGVDVSARTLVELRDLGMEKGMTALMLAAAICPNDQNQIYDVVAALLAAGADPNTAAASGLTPLMAAVGSLKVENVVALLNCAGDKLDLEKTIPLNHASALNIAAYLSTIEVIKVLIQAGANKAHR